MWTTKKFALLPEFLNNSPTDFPAFLDRDINAVSPFWK
jgi:hypothetical protein